jgi:hypothetical protein
MKTQRPGVHLVTFATPRFYHRQFLLGLSARVNGVVDTVTSWSPGKLNDAGFQKKVPDISFSERGVGYWSWKPFIIQKRLSEVPDGDVVLYCDVGRFFPYRLLDQPLDLFLTWMDENHQDIVPGVLIPWHGPMSVWTKRDAFVEMCMDRPEIHRMTPIEATFSIWRKSEQSLNLVASWQVLCAKRQMISDDANLCGLPNLPDFREHRHDQAILTLCCHQSGIRGLDLGDQKPDYDYRTPSEVLKIKWSDKIDSTQSFAGMAIRTASQVMSLIEKPFRGRK